MKHSAMLAVKPDLDMEEAKKVHTSLRKAAGKNYDLTLLDSTWLNLTQLDSTWLNLITIIKTPFCIQGYDDV